MSELLKAILMIPSGGAAKPEIREIANIFSDYSLCSSIANEGLIVSIASIGTLSVEEIRLTLPSIASASSLCSTNKELIIASLTSVYSLSLT